MTEAQEARNVALEKAGEKFRWVKGRGGPGRPKGSGRREALPTPQELASEHAEYAIRRLRELCDSDDEHVVVKAATALAKLAEPTEDDKLLRLLEDRLRDLRAAAEERRQAMAAVTTEAP